VVTAEPLHAAYVQTIVEPARNATRSLLPPGGPYTNHGEGYERQIFTSHDAAMRSSAASIRMVSLAKMFWRQYFTRLVFVGECQSP
jgi:hypothetical protein